MDSETSGLLITAGKAFFGVLVATPIIRDVSRAYNIVDRPVGRKVHAYPIPRVGGVAIALGLCLAMTSARHFTSGTASFASAVWPAAALVFLVGLLDDIVTLAPRWKLLGIAAAAALAFVNGVRADTVAGISLPVWASCLATIFWLVLTTNALNLIDGLDGLCAGVGLISSLALFAAGLAYGNLALCFVCLPLAASLAGFLAYNSSPATVFLGDSGALLIGFLLGCFGVFWCQKSTTLLSIAAPLLLLAVPLADVTLAVVRRKMQGRPVFSADRGHIHHRLLDQGLSPRSAVMALYLVCALCSALAVALAWQKTVAGQVAVVALFAVALAFGVHRLRYTEFHALYRMFPWAPRAECALDKAACAEAWWEALILEAAQAGVISIHWNGTAGRREWKREAAAAASWRERMELGRVSTLELAGAGARDRRVDLLLAAVARTGPKMAVPSEPVRRGVGAA